MPSFHYLNLLTNNDPEIKVRPTNPLKKTIGPFHQRKSGHFEKNLPKIIPILFKICYITFWLNRSHQSAVRLVVSRHQRQGMA